MLAVSVEFSLKLAGPDVLLPCCQQDHITNWVSFPVWTEGSQVRGGEVDGGVCHWSLHWAGEQAGRGAQGGAVGASGGQRASDLFAMLTETAFSFSFLFFPQIIILTLFFAPSCFLLMKVNPITLYSLKHSKPWSEPSSYDTVWSCQVDSIVGGALHGNLRSLCREKAK